MRHSRLLRTAILTIPLAAAAFAAACRNVVLGLGADSPARLATADGLFGGIATRFDHVERDPKVRTARRLIVRSVLTPSRVFADSAAWSGSPTPTSREMIWLGVAEPGRLHFVNDRPGVPLARPGETRHAFRLQSFGDNEYEWIEHADIALGAASPDAIASIPAALFASAERADSSAARSELHALFPNSVREWGRVFSFAATASSRDASGAWTQRHTFTTHTDRAALTYPAFGAWLRNYVSPMRIRLRLRDSTHTWFDAVMRSDSLVIRVRSRDGHLLPLEGGAATLPDTLTLETDFSIKFSVFRVGFRALRAQFAFVNDHGQRGWSMRFTKEPDWQLPFLAEQMLHTPLKRPFAGAGSLYRLTLARDSVGSQTLLARHAVAPVQESAILRFLARLANSGIDAYVNGAEREMGLWLTSSFNALRDDTRTVIQTQTPSR